ncbi:peptidoglycan D,D-transpeptidase FtsI family protein [Paenibacillus soyae]|uniref:Penicillin-binding transpeptidase domain-containing protein n=1 Tax=Paenibacillus soyae TaxID=2969249 RepID=A0A9X2MR11_9BACL|nr:penicillin-binding transpeptidase domain-containing protein [Paenibacillus soyae]MCR2804825.1 penicillin-binding transpeptidase domain-containing protein [Paenibacillus soyae]
MAKRIFAAGLLISLVLLLFVGRLAWLQLLPGHLPAHAPAPGGRDGWKRMAVVQRQRSMVLDTGRGDFVDRYGKPITGETYSALAMFPVRPDTRGDREQLHALASVLEVTPNELQSRWDALEAPGFWHDGDEETPMRLTKDQADAIEKLNVEGIRVLPYRNRYISSFDAKHWIGFTSEHPEWLEAKHPDDLKAGRRKLSEQVGGSGLEKSLDSLLHGIGQTSVSYYMDARNAPLHGLDLRVRQPRNRYYPLQVVTTIDLELQNKLEAYADRMGLSEGAIVVLDTRNADIAAMVSRPKLHPGQFLSADGSEWENHAIKAVEPGSIYKLITAAAALEHRVAGRHETFHCDGEYGKYGLSCWKEGGHGDLSMEEGIAQSCNIVFATLAERLRAEELQRTAESLGVLERVGWHHDRAFGPFAHPLRLLEEEEEGKLFVDPGHADGGVMAQSGIGQRDVRMTPLQAANLIVTLLHRGAVMEPRLVSEIRYASGESMVKLKPRHAEQSWGRIGGGTADILLRSMEAVTDHGTGSSIRRGIWTVAGKSGTAEALRSGRYLNHQWFAGYGPTDSPRYAIAVLAANRPIGSGHQATKLFRGAMDIAAELESGKKGS